MIGTFGCVGPRAHRLIDDNDVFKNKAITERRLVFRNGLTSNNLNLLDLIEQALIIVFHFTNTMTERWPETIRTTLGGGSPFVSWVGPPGLEKRKQATRVWTELIHFLVLEYHVNGITWPTPHTMVIHGESGYLEPMGLDLSEDACDDILDVVNACIYGIDSLKANIKIYFLNIIMQKKATPKNNPLLFWVGRIFQTEEFGDSPRLEFAALKDELTTREKLEVILHYARVLIMDHAFQSWLSSETVSKDWKTKLEKALNPGGMEWINEGRPRPVEEGGDPVDFDAPYWRAFLVHFEDLNQKWLAKGSNSPIGKIQALL